MPFLSFSFRISWIISHQIFHMEKNRSKKSRIDSCTSAGSFLWFSHTLTKRQRNRVIFARSALVKRLQRLQQKKKNALFFERLRNRKLLSSIFGRLSKKNLKSVKNRSTKASKFLDSSMKKSTLTSFETRLDTCIFRMGFTTSFRQLRQWILHGKVLVNLVPVKNFNYQIEPGDIISIKESKKASVNLKLVERIGKKSIISMRPQHLEISSKILAGVLLFKPQQIYYPTPAKLARFSRLTAKSPLKHLHNFSKAPVHLPISLNRRESPPTLRSNIRLFPPFPSMGAQYNFPLKKQTKSKYCRKINNMTVFQRLKKHFKVTRRKWRFTFLKTIKRNKKKWHARTLFRAPKAKILKFFSPELAIS